jgi:hypothetical protein
MTLVRFEITVVSVCPNHNACGNLREKIRLVRVVITLISVTVTLIRVKIKYCV